jgi:hypothetical protein
MTASALKKTMYWLMLSGLLVAAGCEGGGGGVQTYRPTAYPVYGPRYYYPDLSIQEQDPQFWQMWTNSQGGG